MIHLPLALSLDHTAALIASARAGRAFGRTASDGFLIDLPAYDGFGTLARSDLEVMAALYFAAEVELTGLPLVAEALAEQRFALNLTDRGAAEALETLAAAMRDKWIDRALRNQIFLRVFGLGEADANLGDTAVNREFEPRFARFCAAVMATVQDLSGWGAPAGAAMRLALTGNLAGRAQGNTLVVAERLAAQVRLSVTALNHQGLATLFMGRTAWDVVRAVLGPDAPDLQAEVTQAQTGMRLLSWLTLHLEAVQAADAQGVIDAVRAEAGLAGWAEQWLDAAGVRPMGAVA
ncbi:MAG: hypothetical protein ACT4OK_04775 [Gemmobacter sp.]